jgi:hypothetical protein
MRNVRAYLVFDPSIAVDRQICDRQTVELTKDFEMLNTFAKGSGGRAEGRSASNDTRYT